jgi:hypothetical protein
MEEEVHAQVFAEKIRDDLVKYLKDAETIEVSFPSDLTFPRYAGRISY